MGRQLPITQLVGAKFVSDIKFSDENLLNRGCCVSSKDHIQRIVLLFDIGRSGTHIYDNRDEWCLLPVIPDFFNKA
jgi:hypothetical protein